VFNNCVLSATGTLPDFSCDCSLGLNFDTWFLSEEWCTKLMSHWDDRDTWLDLPVDSEPTNQTELWHEARF